MSVGVASIASPVGVNTEIIIDKQTGFIAETENDLFEKLSSLLKNTELRKSVIANAHDHIEKNYSVHAMKPKYLQLINKTAAK